MEDRIEAAVKKLVDKHIEKYGPNSLENGDEIMGVFKDGIIVIAVDDNRTDVNIMMGEPYMFDTEILPEEE